MQPLSQTLGIFDKSQWLGHGGTHTDGGVPTILTKSSMFSFRTASALTTMQMAKLMGHDCDTLDLQGVTETQFRKMLAQSLHKGVAGFLLMGLLASLGCQ